MRTRRLPSPPAGAEDLVSRREAAALLGFGSEFPIRQLEKAGRLRSVRGSMRQAWYPRAEVVALAATLSGGGGRAVPAPRTARGATASPPDGAGRTRWSDGALIALLRAGVASEGGAATTRPPTAVDLVAETGISIARATRVYRFWLSHDVHPTAAHARRSVASPLSGKPRPPEAGTGGDDSSPVAPSPAAIAVASERRGTSRIERDGLIRALRDPDPAVRARAFEKLRPGRKP